VSKARSRNFRVSPTTGHTFVLQLPPVDVFDTDASNRARISMRARMRSVRRKIRLAGEMPRQRCDQLSGNAKLRDLAVLTNGDPRCIVRPVALPIVLAAFPFQRRLMTGMCRISSDQECGRRLLEDRQHLLAQRKRIGIATLF